VATYYWTVEVVFLRVTIAAVEVVRVIGQIDRSLFLILGATSTLAVAIRPLYLLADSLEVRELLMFNYPSSILPLFSKDTRVECFNCSIKVLLGGQAKVDRGKDWGISSLVKN
jgi:hypothetical protein